MDKCYCNKPGGIRVCVMVDGDRDNNGNLTTVHEMEIVFRKTYEWGFSPIGGIYCPRCIRERRYSISPERWAAVNAKYCRNELDL